MADAGVALELRVQRPREEFADREPRPPGPLLVVVEPPFCHGRDRTADERPHVRAPDDGQLRRVVTGGWSSVRAHAVAKRPVSAKLHRAAMTATVSRPSGSAARS